jgi:phosphate transport system protein
MTVHFQRELEGLRKRLLAEAALVEEAIEQAIRAMTGRDLKLAEQVMAGDHRLDQMEVELEEECLKVLALYQPVANDLRFIVAVLKMNNDLERMGDIAANIAKRARWLARHDPIEWPYRIEPMAEAVRSMVKRALDALIEGNAELARQVCLADDEVDDQKRQMTRAVRQAMRERPDDTDALAKLLDVPRHLERIADLATNMAEDVIYLVEGVISRHQHNRSEE